MSQGMPAAVALSDEDVAYKKAYEEKEASRHKSTVQIVYRVVELRRGPMHGMPAAKSPAFVVSRQVGPEGKEERSGTLFRRYDVSEHLKEALRRDRLAAERLGVGIHVTVSK